MSFGLLFSDRVCLDMVFKLGEHIAPFDHLFAWAAMVYRFSELLAGGGFFAGGDR